MSSTSPDLNVTVDANVQPYERNIERARTATTRYQNSLSQLEADLLALEKSIDDHATAALERQHQAMDKTGKAVFTRIPSGAYELRCWSSGQGAMKVNIPADSVVKFEPTKVNAMRIDVSDPSGALAQAGFLDGDFLIPLYCPVCSAYIDDLEIGFLPLILLLIDDG